MDGFGHGFRAGASFLFSLYRSAQVRSPNRPDESRKTRDARGELVQVRLPPRLVELRSLLHTRGHPLVCAARAMYVIPDMDRYVLLNKSDCERLGVPG